MNRKNLTAAVLAGLAGAAGIASTASAGYPVFLNPDGLGEVLLYPYYTVNDGNSTVMSVVNTTSDGKAVKVRFKEGENSREVLDFNLYLSEYDVWSAAVINDGGTPTLLVDDNSCTVPYLYDREFDGPGDAGDGEQEFLDYDFTGDNEDGGSGDIERAMEGHMEIIEMGTLWDDEEYIGEEYNDRPYGTEEAITHIEDDDGNQVPLDCEQVNAQWSTISGVEGLWVDVDPSVDLASLSGGLFGSASVVNVGEGTLFSYDAKALGQFHNDGDLHVKPGTSEPNLNSGDIDAAWVHDDAGFQFVVEFERGVDAVSAVFMHDRIMNEYVLGGISAAESEWVITFPTKAWYVDPAWLDIADVEYGYVNNPEDPGCFYADDHDNNPNTPNLVGDWEVAFDGDGTYGYVNDVGPVPVPPACDVDFTSVETYFPSDPFTSTFDGEACEQAGFGIWDANENASATPEFDDLPIVSPPPPDPETPEEVVFELCYETSVLRFGDSDIFGSRNYHTVNTSNPSGWALIDFGIDGADKDSDPDHVLTGEFGPDSNYTTELIGLPVTGFWAAKFVNGVLPGGVLANYGGLFDHKGSTDEDTYCTLCD